MINVEVEPSKSDEVRNLLVRKFNVAIAGGLNGIEVNAGELHSELGGYPGWRHTMPNICRIMKAETTDGDAVLSEPPSRQGASVTIRYRLPRP